MLGLRTDQAADQARAVAEPIPEQMNAVVLSAYTGVDALRIEQRPVPKPGQG